MQTLFVRFLFTTAATQWDDIPLRFAARDDISGTAALGQRSRRVLSRNKILLSHTLRLRCGRPDRAGEPRPYAGGTSILA